LQGRIISLPDSAPLQGAMIKVNGSTYNSTSDKEGFFNIQNLHSGNYKLSFTYVGFSNIDKEVEVNDNTVLADIGMQPSVFNLGETVVTGTRSERTLKSVPVLTQVISSRQISESGLVSVEKVLESQVAGINFANLNSLTNLTMQGMDAKYVLFLIDGERIAGEMSGNIDYSRLNPGNIERIEVVKGASSALYGSQAIGGVINLITKKNNLPFEMNLQSRYSKFNQLNINSNVGITSGKLSSKTFFVHNSTDGYNLYKTPEYRLYPTQEKFSNYSVGQKFSYDITDKLVVSANGSFYKNERFDAARIQTHRYPKYNDYSYGVNGKYFLSKRTNFEISYYSDKYKSYLVQTLLNRDSLNQNDRLNTLRALANFSISSKHSLIIGSELLQEKIFSERVFGKNKEAYDYNVFAEDEIAVNSQFSINAGARLNRHTGSNIHLTPSLSAIYKLEKWNLRGSYGAGYRTPNLKDLYINFNHGDFVLFGNSSLKAEISNYLSGSVEYLSSTVNSNLELYTNRITNMIGYKSTSFTQDTLVYININKAVVVGANFLSKVKVNKNIYVNGGYSYVHPRDKDTGKKLFGTVEQSANLGIEYRFLKPTYYISFLLQGRYTGDKFYGTDYRYDDSGFTLWRLAVNQVFYSKYSLTLGIENLTDKLRSSSLSCISPGRTFFIQFNLDIKSYKQISSK
jgi:outer membrane receptor for ferrienterochelin and colicins